MIPDKKIVLFIVEGFNDETALAVSLETLISTDHIKFEITDGDVTSDFYGKDIAARVGDCVRNHCEKYNYSQDDFAEVVLLVDMDGVFIDNASYQNNSDHSKPYYNKDKILYNNPDKLIKSHENKRKNLSRLVLLSKVFRTIPFSVYFFSCNLDHVICGDANLTKVLKHKEAVKFDMEYKNNPAGFITFFNTDDIITGSNYKDSWDYIKKDNNSLKRCSNFNIYLSPEAIRIPRDFSGLLAAAKKGEKNGKTQTNSSGH